MIRSLISKVVNIFKKINLVDEHRAFIGVISSFIFATWMRDGVFIVRRRIYRWRYLSNYLLSVTSLKLRYYSANYNSLYDAPLYICFFHYHFAVYFIKVVSFEISVKFILLLSLNKYWKNSRNGIFVIFICNKSISRLCYSATLHFHFLQNYPFAKLFHIPFTSWETRTTALLTCNYRIIWYCELHWKNVNCYKIEI